VTRPVYEKEADREEARLVVSSLGWKAVEREPLCYHDFDVDYGGVVLNVEVKVRGKQYDTYMLSKHKFDYLLGLPYGVLVVAWREIKKIGVVSVSKINNYTFGSGGRKDRGDAKDVEQCVFIPTPQFKLPLFDKKVWPGLGDNADWVAEYTRFESTYWGEA
jgi:hypothetical protein